MKNENMPGQTIKKVRLDILGTNTAAEKLYTSCGFQYVQTQVIILQGYGLDRI